MTTCQPCQVRWADNGPCWCCGGVVATRTVPVDPDPEDDEMYAWGVWG